MKKISLALLLLHFIFVLTPNVNAQSSPNFKLKNYEFGGGGGVNLDSTNYSVEAILGEQMGDMSSGTYKAGAGLVFAQQANVPPAPTLTNGGNWYNKLNVIVNKAVNDPTDALYAIAVSTDSWATVRWVQSDTNTLGDTLGIEDFQSYANWGGVSGELIIGLDRSTTYEAKVKSRHGKYTESPLGPADSAVTIDVTLSFDIDVSSLDAESTAPYAISFGDLTIGSVNTSTERVWVDIESNAENGGYVYVYDQYGGLRSSTVNHTITSSTANLGTENEGYGLQNVSKNETSGGPLAHDPLYDKLNDNVGVVSSSIQEIFNTSSEPIVGGRGAFVIKTKPSNVAPSANDYTDTITLISAASF